MSAHVFPTRHETAILRRIARGHLLITLRDDKPTEFSYEDGSPILNANSHALDEAGFARLSKWLEPDPDDTLFDDGVAQIWRIRKPGKLPPPLPASTPARPKLPPLVPLTHIEWTDRSWNLIRARDRETGRVGWFCVHASAGCANCYSETGNRRYGNLLPYGAQYLDRADFFVPPERLLWRLPKKPCKTFICDMTDLFGEWVTGAMIDTILDRLAGKPQHVFQFLTKRAERMAEYFSRHPASPNWWLGTSVEGRDVLDRIDHLRATPAAVRFVSFEPLLEDLGTLDLEDIHWAIVGCESGTGARPMELDWVRSIRDQCVAKGVAFFFKQALDDAGNKISLPELDGQQWKQFPIA